LYKLLIPILFFWSCADAQKLKHNWSKKLSIPEPSDICLNQAKDGFFIVSDDGILYETNLEGLVLRKSPFHGFDFEAVFADTNGLFVMDERTRSIHSFNVSDLKVKRTVEVNYNGGRNKGFESLTWNKMKKCYVAFTEKDPTWAFELDQNFAVLNKVKVKGMSDISAAAYQNNKLFLLSDEDHAIFRFDPETYQFEKKFKLKVVNPEGLTFGPDGGLYVVSDDMGIMYRFDSSILFN
jgi:uncharacterized protein YjiK